MLEDWRLRTANRPRDDAWRSASARDREPPRHLDGRAPGEAPYTLLDYFPKNYLTIIDESHVTVPQIGGQYEGDHSGRKCWSSMVSDFLLTKDKSSAALRRVVGEGESGRLPIRHTFRFRDLALGPGGRADHSSHRSHRPGGDDPAHQGPDRRPPPRDQRASSS